MALPRVINTPCMILRPQNWHHTAVFSFPLVQQIRFSRYPRHYVSPVVTKEVYEKSEDLPYDTSIPIRAAKNDESSSVFYDPTVAKFTNLLMKTGRKHLARNLLRETFEEIKRVQVEKYHKAAADSRGRIETNPNVIFHRALENIKPVIGLTSITRGGKSYQVPVPLKESRQRFLAMKWLLNEARNKPKPKKQHLPVRLSKEIMAAYNTEGDVIKKKYELHKQADANKAFAHFRWW
ncbi:small ribosomal subunit protein uS7m-like [Saccoglossus kowalevskii]|uniref:28S ribosomal protein S7, mitochondrial-like n=1 Tax=Saccoglossus kowalevskii TaxID=10224 RepID=A0ABM0GPS2_SACKO|nr:PREDICTED: 28S ribosomal protein S7, mitochondrial-like [Saccoglossus kowalevskii]